MPFARSWSVRMPPPLRADGDRLAPLPGRSATIDVAPPPRRLSAVIHADWMCAWIGLEGHFVGPAADQFDRAWREALALGTRKVVIVLDRVEVIDAGGRRCLGDARKQAKARGIRLTVRSLERHLQPRPGWLAAIRASRQQLVTPRVPATRPGIPA
jgi:STAS domain